MLLNSGNPNVIDTIRRLIADPDTSPNVMFTDQNITDFFNIAYDDICTEAAIKDYGEGVKRAYTSIVADQPDYTLPTDFVAPVSLEIDLDGTDLSVSAGDPTILTFFPAEDRVMEAVLEEEITKTSIYFIRDNSIVIQTAPETAGTNNLRFTFKALNPHLANATDEPLLPRQHHMYLCLEAAVNLQASIKADIGDNAVLLQRAERRFQIGMAERARDHYSQIASQARPKPPPPPFKSGHVVRGVNNRVTS